MIKEQYNSLVMERDSLKEHLTNPQLKGNLKVKVQERLTIIREELSNAHHDQYNKSGEKLKQA